jgi:hypothetical protein
MDLVCTAIAETSKRGFIERSARTYIDGGVYSSLEIYAKFTDVFCALEHLFDLVVYLLQIKTPVGIHH